MNKGKYVFSQLLDFLDRNDFNYLAKKYDGDKYVKQFTCYNQLATLVFGQLSNRESLRDVVLATQALAPKAYALGFGKFVTRSNLSKANNNRDYHIFEEFAYQVVAEAWGQLRTEMEFLHQRLYFVGEHPSPDSSSGSRRNILYGPEKSPLFPYGRKCTEHWRHV